jgi:hypothetical protein
MAAVICGKGRIFLGRLQVARVVVVVMVVVVVVVVMVYRKQIPIGIQPRRGCIMVKK